MTFDRVFRVISTKGDDFSFSDKLFMEFQLMFRKVMFGLVEELGLNSSENFIPFVENAFDCHNTSRLLAE